MHLFKWDIVKKLWKNIGIEIIILFGLIFVWAYLFSVAEWWDYFTSLYLTVITIGSVGYGDVTPVTHMGRTLSMIYALIGVPMYVFASSIIIIGGLMGLKEKSGKKAKSLEVRSGVKGLIKRDDKYLFLKQEILGELYWDLPGGRIHYGEVPIYSLRREIFEETSLDVDIHGSAGLWYFFTKDTRAQIVSHVYFCSLPKQQKIVLQNTDDETVVWYKWSTVADILEDDDCIMDDNLKDLLVHLPESK
jgi:ADP-ribose pyrophosphatase YjhB (NUDIX family)